MFADFPSTDLTNEIHDQTVKDPVLSPVQGEAQPQQSLNCRELARPQIEPGRTPAPRMESVRRSRDSQRSRLPLQVNENP